APASAAECRTASAAEEEQRPEATAAASATSSAESRQNDEDEDHHDEDEKRNAAARVRAIVARLPRARRAAHRFTRRLAAANLRHQIVGGSVESSRVIAALKMRRDVVADHARGKCVGDRPFESVSGFDANFSLL